MSYISKHKEGFWGTIIVHAIVLLLLLMLGFFTPLPLPGEEGILVNFGDSEQGFGTEEPAPARESASTPPIVREEQNQPVQQTPPPPANTSTPSPAEEEILTQDIEKTAAIESAKLKAEEAKKKQEEIDRQKKIDDQKRIAEEKLKKEQLEKERLAEIERQKEIEEERLRQEAETKRIAEINSRAANAFGAGGAGTNNSESTSQGITYPSENQGNPNGDSSTNYGDGGSGSGNSGNGPSFSLSGRNALSLPKPEYPGNEEAVVVVSVTVDKNGNVTKADPGAQGSNTINTNLLAAAKQAALKAKFNADNTAAALQRGTITYRFVLD